MAKKFYQSFTYAWNGIVHIFTTQRNFRIHLLIAFIVLLFGFYLGVCCADLVSLVIVICFVLISEMINTAIEEIVNLVTPTRRAGATIAKDVAAGTVLFSSICAIIVGCLVFIPHIINLPIWRTGR